MKESLDSWGVWIWRVRKGWGTGEVGNRRPAGSGGEYEALNGDHKKIGIASNAVAKKKGEKYINKCSTAGVEKEWGELQFRKKEGNNKDSESSNG